MSGNGPRIGILAGEVSGDYLGAGLMTAIRSRHPDATFTGIGGTAMGAAGLDSMVPMERLSVMGLVEPLRRLPELLGIRRRLFNVLSNQPPDVFIGIDSPEFNLTLERKLRAAGIPTVHYVSPSVWAWRQGRIRKIKQAVNLMLTLFPFENAFYEDHDVPVRCVGHPLADEFPLETDTAAARATLGLPGGDRVLAVLPGSRAGEVGRLGPVFLGTARRCLATWPGMQVLIPCAGADRKAQLQAMLAADPVPGVTLLDGRSREAMAAADCVLMASGTATLEAMLLKKPMVVAYKMAPLSYAIISRMLKAPYIALPNLLAGRMMVPEILQDAVTVETLYGEISRLWDNRADRRAIVDTWMQIHRSLRRNANETAASAVLELCGR